MQCITIKNRLWFPGAPYTPIKKYIYTHAISTFYMMHIKCTPPLKYAFLHCFLSPRLIALLTSLQLAGIFSEVWSCYCLLYCCSRTY